MANKYIKDLTTTTNPSLTGHTIFDNGVSTFKTSLETLKDTIVDGVSHTFEGDQTINGNLTISGSIIAQQYILSSSITNMVTETISGSSNFGNSNDDNHSFTGSVKIKGTLSLNDVQLDVSGSGSHLAFFTGPQSVTSSEYFHVVANGQTLGLGTDAHNPENEYRETLVVGAAGSHNIATFQNAPDNHYVAVNIINYNSGDDASADLVIGNDANAESSSYVNLGINSSNHTNLTCGYAGDAYLANFGNDMYVGSMTRSTNPHGHTHIFGGGAWRTAAISVYANSSIGFHTEKIDEQLTTIPSSSYGYRVEFAENVKMDKNLKVDGWVSSSHFVGDGSQLTNLPSDLTDVSMFVSSSDFNSFTSSYLDASASFDSRITDATNEQDLSFYATTGSNTFTDNQTINGIVYVNELQNNGQDLNIKSYNYNNIGLWAEGGTVNITGSLNITDSATINGENVVSSNTIQKIETITSAAYALITPVNGTLYIIID